MGVRKQHIQLVIVNAKKSHPLFQCANESENEESCSLVLFKISNFVLWDFFKRRFSRFLRRFLQIHEFAFCENLRENLCNLRLCELIFAQHINPLVLHEKSSHTFHNMSF